jgi:hypothetical protein
VFGTPIQQPFVTNRLSLCAFTLVVRAYGFAEVFAVGEVEGNVVGVEP